MSNSLKVLLVDDERLERMLLRKCVDWTHFDMEIVAEAANADEALSYLESNPVDIVFTDIQMPVIDGMQFISIASKKYPQLKFVVLTGFDQFSYAQKGIKLGISDFLVKPINDEDVVKTLSSLKMIIEQEREEQNENERLRKQLYENLPYLKEHFLRELITGIYDKKTIKERLSFLGLSFRYQSFQVAAIVSSQSENETEEFKYITNLKLMNYVSSFSLKNPHLYCFFDNVNRIILLNNDENSDLYELCRNLSHRVSSELGMSIGTGLGSLRNEPQEISISYKEALDALDYRVAAGNSAIILYDRISSSPRETSYSFTEYCDKFSLYIKSGLNLKAKEVIDYVFNNYIDLKSSNVRSSIHSIATELSFICLRYSIDYEPEHSAPYSNEIQSFSEIFKLTTIPEIKSYLYDLVDRATTLIGQQQIKTVNKLIMGVKKYIEDNYSDPSLSLAGVARIFYLNPSYLSRTFKKETGISFIKYLTSIRMEKAIEIINNKEDFKIFEISEAVGISDPNYFGTCFKKYKGISVSDYKSVVVSGGEAG